MSLGPSISIFGDRHSLLYWIVFFGGIFGLVAFSSYRKAQGRAGKYDLKLVAILLGACVMLIGIWKLLVMSTIH